MGLLTSSSLTPWLIQSIVRLGATESFARATESLHYFTGVTVSEETVRRLTETIGAVQVTREIAAVEEIERTLPNPPQGSSIQLLSVDGAFVHLTGKQWAEVKTLVLAEIRGTPIGPRAVLLSYFSCLGDGETFARLATVETQRRGTTTAGTVVAVTDGARWCQSFIDLHRFDAVRVLDFPHAVEHLSTVAQAVFGPGTAEASEWLGVHRHALRHGQEELVLAAVAGLARQSKLPATAVETVKGALTYLATRREHIRYAHFSDAGWPIGSGCVESANKLVVEARLKGAGMHWARANVNPMLALRTLLANHRWTQTWPALWRAVCAAARCRPAAATPATPPPVDPSERAALVPAHPPEFPASMIATPRAKTMITGHPTKEHPWKRGFAARAKH